ncbi:MAG: hemolysin family protein [Candidatus Dormibacter sp.]|uniref:hemolysin family protein n=1 Tax=Candidatus Dormibacter sp. TaxID=2973982 RepID=UPI000DB01D11|nr:MAG: HlyC/CorC family transporter [Candidatus Dormibacteraeota bacterium]
MSATSSIELTLLIVCVLLAALASATETALTSVGRLRVRHLAEEGSHSARTLQRLHEQPNRFLSTVLIVNTVALIMASSATTLLGLTYLPHSWGVAGDLAVSLVLSLFLLIFAEVTPKTLAIRNAERLALFAAAPVEALARFLRPFLWFITLVSRAVTGGRAAHAAYLTEQELRTLLRVSEEQGVIEEKEEEMINSIIEIGDMSVREVMIPRTDVSAIPKTAEMPEILKVFEEKGHTRLPVYDEDLDHIVGLLHVKDLLLYLAKGGQPGGLEGIMRPIRKVPGAKKVDELLYQMQVEKVHMMVVLDEYGGTDGIVTLEDVLEEIVGEIRDEFDPLEEEQMVITGLCEALVDARYSMADLNERLELGVEESRDYDSVGGYVYATVGDVPEPGMTFEAVPGIQWRVEQIKGDRIERLRLHADRPWPDEVLVEAGFDPPPRTGAGEEIPSAPDLPSQRRV